MKIYFGGIKTGKTTKMINDFIMQDNSLFISDEMNAATFKQKYCGVGLNQDIINSHKFAHINNLTIKKVEDILNQNIGIKNIFIDVPKFVSQNTIEPLKKLENKYNVALNCSSQKELNAIDKKLDIIEI